MSRNCHPRIFSLGIRPMHDDTFFDDGIQNALVAVLIQNNFMYQLKSGHSFTSLSNLIAHLNFSL